MPHNPDSNIQIYTYIKHQQFSHCSHYYFEFSFKTRRNLNALMLLFDAKNLNSLIQLHKQSGTAPISVASGSLCLHGSSCPGRPQSEQTGKCVKVINRQERGSHQLHIKWPDHCEITTLDGRIQPQSEKEICFHTWHQSVKANKIIFSSTLKTNRSPLGTPVLIITGLYIIIYNIYLLFKYFNKVDI